MPTSTIPCLNVTVVFNIIYRLKYSAIILRIVLFNLYSHTTITQFQLISLSFPTEGISIYSDVQVPSKPCCTINFTYLSKIPQTFSTYTRYSTRLSLLIKWIIKFNLCYLMLIISITLFLIIRFGLDTYRCKIQESAFKILVALTLIINLT